MSFFSPPKPSSPKPAPLPPPLPAEPKEDEKAKRQRDAAKRRMIQAVASKTKTVYAGESGLGQSQGSSGPGVKLGG